jgi:hypothetical protein
MSCTWPVMRFRGCLLVPGVHMNIVKSSLPLISRSGLPPVAASPWGRGKGLGFRV